LASLFGTLYARNALGLGQNTLTSPRGFGLAGLLTRRKAFFSFHFDDVMRVNVVRNAFKIYNPQNSLLPTFYDSSLWEAKKLESDDSLKKLIRGGVEYTSVVCVLIGSSTWTRRWVKYEIARSVIDEKGLVGVHINGIKHHQTSLPHVRGINPIAQMAVGKTVDGTFRLFEKTARGWEGYQDFTGPVKLPAYLVEPQTGYVTALNVGTREYDFSQQNGHSNIGGWLDMAASDAGR
jgi:MTH538 TIR-like domain (DUF1863)